MLGVWVGPYIKGKYHDDLESSDEGFSTGGF